MKTEHKPANLPWPFIVLGLIALVINMWLMRQFFEGIRQGLAHINAEAAEVRKVEKP